MIERLLLHVTTTGTGIEPPEDDPRGLKHVGAKIQDKITGCNIL
jgi:hypothetical protein